MPMLWDLPLHLSLTYRRNWSWFIVKKQRNCHLNPLEALWEHRSARTTSGFNMQNWSHGPNLKRHTNYSSLQKPAEQRSHFDCFMAQRWSSWRKAWPTAKLSTISVIHQPISTSSDYPNIALRSHLNTQRWCTFANGFQPSQIWSATLLMTSRASGWRPIYLRGRMFWLVMRLPFRSRSSIPKIQRCLTRVVWISNKWSQIWPTG